MLCTTSQDSTNNSPFESPPITKVTSCAVGSEPSVKELLVTVVVPDTLVTTAGSPLWYTSMLSVAACATRVKRFMVLSAMEVCSLVKAKISALILNTVAALFDVFVNTSSNVQVSMAITPSPKENVCSEVT